MCIRDSLTTLRRSHNPRFLQLVHDAAGTIITDGKLTLNERCGTLLVNNNETGCILEQRIETSHIHIPQITSCMFIHIFGQIESSGVTPVSYTHLHKV